ncbi:unnamed protein product [Adineta steineri]|uniref:Uncharacterized protein n=1 Tax=Adineta steineri TaxID=433720 RepID=A0A813YP78_9BILA|nr:unnamed protein product [Adineta steineri]
MGYRRETREPSVYQVRALPKQRQEPQEFAPPGTCKELICDGRPCANCHRCRDWHFTGDQDQWNWICNHKNWKEKDDKRWYNSDYELFTKRDRATCVVSSLRGRRSAGFLGLGVGRSYYAGGGYGGYSSLCHLGFSDICLCDKH